MRQQTRRKRQRRLAARQSAIGGTALKSISFAGSVTGATFGQAVVESPLYDGRGVLMLAEAKKLSPGKPIRFIVNAHHHFDHSGGLCNAVA